MKDYTLSELKELSQKHPIVAFDGVCNLCNNFIQWLIKRDKKKQFRFTTLQSNEGNLLKTNLEIDGDTVILLYQGEMYTLSDVALKSMQIIGGFWTPLSWLRYAPKGLRDFIYNWIAKNRYKWFGKKDVCMLPDQSVRSLFL